MTNTLKWLIPFTMLCSVAAQAATYTLPNGTLPSGCTKQARVVTCSNFNLANNDVINISGGALVTLNINGTAQFQNAEVNVNGGPNKLAINVSGNLQSNTNVKIEANISATGSVSIGYNGSLKGDISANSASLGGATRITGNIYVNSTLTSGSNAVVTGELVADSINLGSNTTIGGQINTIGLTTGSNVTLSSSINADTVSLATGNSVTGNINATVSISTGSNSQIAGNLQAPSVSLGSANTLTGSISADTISIQASNTSVNGSLTATSNIALGSGGAITGDITAGGNITTVSPVAITGNVDADGDFNLASGSAVIGNIDATNITLAPSNSLVTGDISASSNLLVGSGNNVVGDIFANTITLASSNALIDGNATAVTSVTINYGTILGDVTAPHIENNGGTIVGDIFCDTRTGLIRECLTASSGGTSGSAGIDSCSQAFSDMMGYGVIGDTSFTYGNKATINNTDITGSNGNSPTPSGQVAPVPTSFPGLQPSSFPSFNTGSTDKNNATNIAPGSYGEISTSNHSSTSGGTYYIDKVSLTSSSAKMTLAAGQYYINSVVLDGQSELLLDSGNYFINTVDIADQAEINLVPGASVNIFLGTSLASGTNSKINKNGSVSGLAIFLYSGASFTLAKDQGDHNNRFTGLIYSPFTNTTINIGEKTHYEGGIVSAGTVELGDKVKIDFDAVTTKEQILEAAGCSALPPDPVLDHYRIVLHEQELVSCYAAPVTVKACANADCSSLYANTIEGTLNSTENNAVWNGTSSNTAAFTFATGESTYGLSLVPGGSSTISLNNLVPVAGNTTQCVDASGTATSCDILFKTAGLLVSAASPTAGVDTLVTVRAVEANTTTGACMARATGTQSVRLGMECSNPGSCAVGQSFTANGQLLSMYNNTGNADNFYNSIANTSVSLNFDSSGTATFNANYTDVGHIRIHAALDLGEAPNAGEPYIDDPDVMLSGTGSYVVRPHSLVVIPLNDDGTEWTDTNDAYKAAGELFKVAIQSFNADGAITPNFGNEIETPKGSVAFHSVAFPTNGYGDQSDLDVSALSLSTQQNLLGALVYEGAIWNEAGTVNLTAVLEELYLNAGDAANKPASPIGRFYPHHFVVDDSTSIVRNSCTSSNYTYMGQPEIDIELKLLAVNTSGKIVRNYGRNNYAGSAVVEAFALDTSNVNRLVANLNADWLNGELINLVSDANFVRLANNNPDGPFDNVKVHLAILSENDGRDFLNSSEEIPNGTLHLKYGRMVLENIYGPEDVQLNVQLNTEYWDGERFALHSADNCTAFENDNSNPAVGLNVVSDPASLNPVSSGLTSGTLVEGAVAPGDLYWLPPSGVDPRGEFEFEYNAPEWLRFDWGRVGDLNGTNQNPQATAGFGLYRGNDKIIFSLERNF